MGVSQKKKIKMEKGKCQQSLQKQKCHSKNVQETINIMKFDFAEVDISGY